MHSTQQKRLDKTKIKPILGEGEITYGQLHSGMSGEEEDDEKVVDEKDDDVVCVADLQQIITELTTADEKETKEKDAREEWVEGGVQYTRNYMASVKTSEVLSEVMREAHEAGGAGEKIPANCTGALQAQDLGRCHKRLHEYMRNPAQTLESLDKVTPPAFLEQVITELRAVCVQRVGARLGSDGGGGKKEKAEIEEEKTSGRGNFTISAEDVRTLADFYQVLYHTYHVSFAQAEVAAGFKLAAVLPHSFKTINILRLCQTSYSEADYLKFDKLCGLDGPFVKEVLATGTISETTFDKYNIPDMPSASSTLMQPDKAMGHRRAHLINHAHAQREKERREKVAAEAVVQEEKKKAAAAEKKEKKDAENKKQVEANKRLRKELSTSKAEQKDTAAANRGLAAKVKELTKQLAEANKEGGAGRKKDMKKRNTVKEETEDAICGEDCARGNTWNKNDSGVQCDYCKTWFHYSCIGLTEDDFNEDEEYKCTLCDNKPKKRRT